MLRVPDIGREASRPYKYFRHFFSAFSAISAV
jgi:hypothetical protein